MNYFVYSEAGHNHKNEDTVAVKPHPKDESVLLCFLADGQGGQFGGGVASQIAVSTCLELACNYSVRKLLKSSTWYEILLKADEVVNDEINAGFTTLIGLCVIDGKVCGASCGDSAALLINDVGYIDLTKKQRKNPPFGSNAAFSVAFTEKFKKATLIIMSDGVWRYVGNDTIVEICREKQGQESILSLRQLQFNQNGEKLADDFSVILV